MNNDLPSGIAGARTKNVRAKFYAALAFKPTDALFKLLRPIDPETDHDGFKRTKQLADITALLLDMDASYADRDNSEAIAGLMALTADKKAEPVADAAKKQLETDEEKAARKQVQEAEAKKRKAALALYRKLKRDELRKANEARFKPSDEMRALGAAQRKAKADAKQAAHTARQAQFNNTAKADLMRRMNVKVVTHHRSRSL